MKAVLVEDNPGAVNVLKSYLAEYHVHISLCEVATTIERAREIIIAERPDIWSLDIQLHDKLIFQLIRELDPVVVDRAIIIFITAYYNPSYIHEALKFSALDFIVKPVDRDQLFGVLDKAVAALAKKDFTRRIDQLEERIRLMDLRQTNPKVPVHRVSGEIDYVDRKDIVYIENEAQVTRVHMADANKNLSTTHPLKSYEDMFKGDQQFQRISKQVILNLAYLKSFNPKSDVAQLHDGTSIQVSRRKAARLIGLLSGKEA
jgi:two-component system LytT family response regulator